MSSGTEVILNILKVGELSYEINPAHCSKSVYDQYGLAMDHDFDKFVTLFELTDWTTKRKLIAAKLFDDERYIDFLARSLPLSAMRRRLNLMQRSIRSSTWVMKEYPD